MTEETIKQRLRQRFAEARERAIDTDWDSFQHNSGMAMGLAQAWAEVFNLTMAEAIEQIKEQNNG